MNFLLTKCKIYLIEAIEQFINDERFLLTSNLFSEAIKLHLGIKIKEKNKTNRSNLFYLLVSLIFLKIKAKIIGFVLHYNNLVTFTKTWNDELNFNSTFTQSTFIGLAFIAYSYVNLTKRKAQIGCFSPTNLLILVLIFMTPGFFKCCALLVFFRPDWFVFIISVVLFYENMFTICAFLTISRFLLNNHKIFNNLKIAFIADGSRRYLKNNNLPEESVKSQGIHKIYEISALCAQLGVQEVGFYCFSIKNFSRPKSEVENLMSLIENGRKQYKADNVSMRFKVYGRLNLLKEGVRRELNELVETTKNNKDITVNLFIAYTTTDELENGILFDGDVDLLVRTSGEQRLSDFLIRQVSRGTHVFFAKPLWPELSILHFLLIIVKYKLEVFFFKK